MVGLRVEDVAPNGYTVERATIRQRKTRRPVKFELTEQTRQVVEDYLRASGKKPGAFLFSGGRQGDHCITTRQYARLVAEWIGSIGLDPRLFRYAFIEADESYPDLPAHRKPSRSPTPAGPYEN